MPASRAAQSGSAGSGRVATEAAAATVTQAAHQGAAVGSGPGARGRYDPSRGGRSGRGGPEPPWPGTPRSGRIEGDPRQRSRIVVCGGLRLGQRSSGTEADAGGLTVHIRATRPVPLLQGRCPLTTGPDSGKVSRDGNTH